MRRFGTPLRAMFLCVGVTALLALGTRATRADDPPPAQVKPVKSRPLTPQERGPLLDKLKAYLDPDGDAGKSRRELGVALASLKGFDLLADMDALTVLVYQARPFPEPPLAKRHLPKNSDFHEVGTMVSLVTPEPLRFTLVMPKSYAPPADPKKPFDKPPTPLIVTLHEKQDYQGPKGAIKFPGEEVLKRRFDPAGLSKAVLEEWALLAPVATQGKWVGDDGIVLMKDAVVPPMRETWTRYHVDFDRMVIDGGSEALQIAASRPHLFAGVIVRGDQADVAPEIVKNLAHVAVYVVGSAASAAAKTLPGNGFPADRLKVGGAEGLADWLKTVKRATPKSFHWTMKDREMTTANWVAINSAESGVGVVPTLDVEVVDTAEQPNTIKIRSKAVRGIALLLNDRIVDLDREVRVVVNGQPVTVAQVPEGNASREVKLPMKFERSSDTTFLAPPLKVRRNLQYGMLFPVILDGIKIAGDDPGDAPPPAPAEPAAPPAAGAKPAEPGAAPAPPAEPAKLTPEQIEDAAKRKFEKAEGYEKDGNLDIAKKLYTQVVGLGATTYKDRAEAKLKELETKK